MQFADALDIVICLNPMSARVSPRSTTMLERLAAARRRRSAAILDNECRKLATKVQLVVLEPDVDDLNAMGLNPMARDRAERVMASARESVARTVSRLPGVFDLSAAVAG